MRHLLRRAPVWLSLLGLVLWPAAAGYAQTVHGTISETDGGEPLSGAFVVLLDEDDTRAAGGLTDERGRYRLRASAPGTYRLRVDRIGYASTSTDPFRLESGQVLERSIIASTSAIQIEGVSASAERRCEVRPGDGAETAQVWEEARKALQATAWAEEQNLFRYRVERYERLLDRDGRVEREERDTRSGFFQRPFRSVAADQLAEGGFVQRTDEGTFYFAPDAEVLLSDAFLDTHCFRLRRGTEDEAGLVGLAFEPAGDRGLPDITGVLWLDPETAELRHLRYRYTRLRLDVPTDQLGGRVAFERLPTGAWIVRHWSLRTPRIGVQRADRFTPDERRILIGVKEDGGEVVRIAGADGGAVLETEPAAVAGVVYDSTRARGLAGARVFLSGTARSTRTDSAGRFRLEGSAEGSYTVGFDHPRLDSLGIVPDSRSVELRQGAAATVELAIPSRATILAAGCGERAPGDTAAVLVGSVREASTDVQLTDANLVLRWDSWALQDRGRAGVTTQQRTDTMRVTASPAGTYRACGLPPDVTIEYWAEALGRSSDTATVRLAAGEAVSRAIAVPLSPQAAEQGEAAGRREPEGERGDGNVIGRSTIESYVDRGAADVADLLRMQGRGAVRLRPIMSGANPGGVCIEVGRPARPSDRAGCAMATLVVDGSTLSANVAPRYVEELSADAIQRIELLAPAQATARLGTAAGRGAVVITTRRGG